MMTRSKMIKLHSRYGILPSVSLRGKQYCFEGRWYVSYQRALQVTKHAAGDHYPGLIITGECGGMAWVEPWGEEVACRS
jgi:hypothetical protein